MAYLLDHLLSESAARRPDGIAVIHEQNSLTYGELEASSNRLAHALLASGVKPGDRVGIYLSKSIESIISVFGIMKAGRVMSLCTWPRRGEGSLKLQGSVTWAV